MRWSGLGLCRAGRKHRILNGSERDKRCFGGRFEPAGKCFPTRIYTKPEMMLECLIGDGFRKYAEWLTEKTVEKQVKESAPKKSGKADEQ